MTAEETDIVTGLTDAQLEILREALQRRRADLRARLGTEQSALLQGEQLAEPMDAAEQTREQDDGVLFGDRDRALLAEVEHALAKLETGRYGVSEISGAPIDFRRLSAIPWTRVAADEADAT